MSINNVEHVTDSNGLRAQVRMKSVCIAIVKALF